MKHRVKSVTCRTVKSVWAIKSVDDEKGEATGRLPGLKRRACQGSDNTTGICERSAVRNGYRYAANRAHLTHVERIHKTVVSCRGDMEAYPEECEADGRRKKCYHLSKSAPSEMDKITTNREILPAIRKCKKVGCQGYGTHEDLN